MPDSLPAPASVGEFIFMMGLPAAGKSTYAVRQFKSTHNFIDPDQIKTLHPEYDPENAFVIHDWSTDVAENLFNAALMAGGNWLLDGTGTNSEAMVRKMSMARAHGFTVKLVYVTVSRETSLRRAALRERKVPRAVIEEKARNIETSFRLVSPHADSVVVVAND
jgi:predicted kinase